MSQRIRDDLWACEADIARAIDQLCDDAKAQGLTPYQFKDVTGRYLFADYTAQRAAILIALMKETA